MSKIFREIFPKLSSYEFTFPIAIINWFIVTIFMIILFHHYMPPFHPLAPLSSLD